MEFKMIHVESPRMTIGQLSDRIEARTSPVRISGHVGNQTPSELVAMAGLPVGVDVMMVDTIQGTDKNSSPYLLRRSFGSEQLMSKTSARDKIVGSLIATDPLDGLEKSLASIHQRALDELPLHNRPITMLKYFSSYPDTLRAMVASCLETGSLQRVVEPSGKIKTSMSPPPDTPIYGLDDTSGLLLPLNGMMAVEMLISMQQQSDLTLHLGGNDMVVYTKDQERMAIVDDLFVRTCALLGIKNRQHTYQVIDSRGLAIINEQSQHELLESGTVVDISHHLDKPTGLEA